MAKSTSTAKKRIKVKRTRRRLYEKERKSDTKKTTGRVPDITPVAPSPEESTRRQDADKIVRRYTAYSAGTAFIPLPVVDFIAVTAIQLALLKKLSSHYDIQFSAHRGKSLIAALIGGLHAGLFTGSFLKMVPVVGLAGAIVPIATLSGGLTYAVGKVFIHHFEAGGTLLDFNPSKLEKYFEQKFREGQNEAMDQPSPE